MTDDLLHLHAQRGCCVENPRAIQMQQQPMASRKLGCPRHVVKAQDLSVVRVFQHEQSSHGKMRIIRLDPRPNELKIQATVGGDRDRLRLYAAKDRGPASFILISMIILPYEVLLAALAVGQQCHQIALSPGRQQQSRFFAGETCNPVLQRIDARVIAENIITHRRAGHLAAHGYRRLGGRITSQVYHFKLLGWQEAWNIAKWRGLYSMKVSGRYQYHRFPGHVVAAILIFTLSH